MAKNKLSKKVNSHKSKSRKILYVDRKKEWFKGKEIERLYVTDYKGDVIKVYRVDDRLRNMKSINDRHSNEKALKNYFRKIEGIETKKLTKLQIKKEVDKRNEDFYKKNIKEGKVDKKTEKVFTTTSTELISTKKRGIIKDYNFMYIRAKVKIFFDGFYVVSYGRSDYFYRNLTPELAKKGYKQFRKGIPLSLEKSALAQAILRALAPYGYDLEFKLLEWRYAYHKDRF